MTQAKFDFRGGVENFPREVQLAQLAANSHSALPCNTDVILTSNLAGAWLWRTGIESCAVLFLLRHFLFTFSGHFALA